MTHIDRWKEKSARPWLIHIFQRRIFLQKTIGFTFPGEKFLIGFPFSCFPKIWKLGNDFFGEKTAFIVDDVDTDATPTVFRESSSRSTAGRESRARARALKLRLNAGARSAAAALQKSEFSAKNFAVCSHDPSNPRTSLSHSPRTPPSSNGSTRLSPWMKSFFLEHFYKITNGIDFFK